MLLYPHPRLGGVGALGLGSSRLRGPVPPKALKRRDRNDQGTPWRRDRRRTRRRRSASCSRSARARSTASPRRSSRSPRCCASGWNMTGKNITLGKYAMISLGLSLVVAVAPDAARMRRSFWRCLLGLFVGVGVPHFVIGKMIMRRINKFNVELPGCDRTDGPRPAFGSSDHRNARHRRRAKSPARSASSSAWLPTR